MAKRWNLAREWFTAYDIFTAHKWSLGQDNIFKPVCHSVHGRVPGQVPPRPGTPPGTRCIPLGPGLPPGPGTPPRTRYTPWHQVHPLGPGTPLDQVHPLGHVHPPQTRYTPRPGTPPRTRYPLCILRDTVNKRAVRILLECILVSVCPQHPKKLISASTELTYYLQIQIKMIWQQKKINSLWFIFTLIPISGNSALLQACASILQSLMSWYSFGDELHRILLDKYC